MSLIDPEFIVRIEQIFEHVLSTYRWHIKYLYTDKDAIRIEYELTPPIFIPNEDNVIETFTSIWGNALDDLGNEYQSVGGAFGLSHDKQSTEGVISFFPLPTIAATSIQFFVEIKRGNKKSDSVEFSVPLKSNLVSNNSNNKN